MMYCIIKKRSMICDVLHNQKPQYILLCIA